MDCFNVSSPEIRFPDCGAVVDPTAIFRDITQGTSFENDEAMQGHLKVFTGEIIIHLWVKVDFVGMKIRWE